MPTTFRNPWSAAGSGIDQQRSDLFYVMLSFPQILLGQQGASLWDSEIAFAIQNFPFPDRARETMPIKYLNQTNFGIGADAAMSPIDIEVRYAFNRRTIELLERWSWLISNPNTGGVGLGSAVKTTGYFFWLVPDMEVVADVDNRSPGNVMRFGARYRLDGVWVRSLKPGNADMTTTNQGVNYTFSLQIDRYYPEKVSDLNPQTFLSAINRGSSDILGGQLNGLSFSGNAQTG